MGIRKSTVKIPSAVAAILLVVMALALLSSFALAEGPDTPAADGADTPTVEGTNTPTTDGSDTPADGPTSVGTDTPVDEPSIGAGTPTSEGPDMPADGPDTPADGPSIGTDTPTSDETDAPVDAPVDGTDTSRASRGGVLLAALNNSDLTPQNGIPLVIVRVNEAEGGSITAMNNSYQHSAKCTSATVEIVVPEGYSGGYASAGTAQVPSGEMPLNYVRGRGNSTWESSKKPYKLELNGKQDLFGMGASEDWALLANSFDATLMRNRITFWLGEQMGLAYTPRQVPVDLVMIGSDSGVHKYGSYYLCETIKVEDSRVAIDKLKKNDADNITGGYLMATYGDQGEDIPQSTTFTTSYGVEFANDTPEYDDTNPNKPLTDAQLAQRSYVRTFMQELEDLIMAPGDIDAARHEEIANRMDLASLADYWLLQEISFNTDAFATTSTYLYKERDGKLYWGPLWDFDYAWNNNGLWNDSNRTFNNTAMLWIDQLRDKDPQFVSLLQERWAVLSGLLEELTEADGIIDRYAAELSASQHADYEIWKDTTGDYKGTSESDYDAAVEALRSWIVDRLTWAEANKADIGKVFYTVSYEANGQVVATERVRYGNKAVMNPDAPAPKGKVFSCWMKGNKTADNVEIKENTTFTAAYVDEGEAVAPENLIIFTTEESVELSRGFFPTSDMYETTLDELTYVEPYDATNQHIRWTSSDEAVASIDEVNHRVVLNGGGDATITGTLYNGASASFVLHVDGEPAKYTVRFVNDDGTELQSSKIPRGDTPTYTGAAPTKAETARYTYEFVGWTPEIVPVTGNTEYRATYAEKAKPGVYELASGANGTWTEGSANPLVFVFKRTVDDETTIGHFVGIEVDTEVVPEKDSSGRANYAVESGSAIVSLQPTFLATLAHGDHTLKASFDDGNDVEAPFRTVAEEDPSPEPQDDDGKDDDTDHKDDDAGEKDDHASRKDEGTNNKNDRTDNKNGGTSTNAKGTSRKSNLPGTGDAPNGTVVYLLVAAACSFLLAAFLRGQRNYRA